MKTSALVTFLIMAAYVWGGVALIVWTAFRKEREKGRAAAHSPAGGRVES
jgi:hypothetical protein